MSAYRPPSPEAQLQFLGNVQRLLGEGQFVATYKFALLQAIADLCIEQAGDDPGPVRIPLSRIADKFIAYYHRQVRPFQGRQLRYATGGTPEIVKAIDSASSQSTQPLYLLQKDGRTWKKLARSIESTVKKMPLWKLQTIGKQPFEFLYRNDHLVDGQVELFPGVAFCLRRFHPLITDLVQGDWVRFVRRNNADILGAESGLDEFLFGSERTDLGCFKPILRQVQENRCLYCQREIPKNSAHVDHFVPWAIYPSDLGHNMVLAHSKCNLAKSDYLAAKEHLCRWVERNRSMQEQLAYELDRANLLQNIATSEQIARWAYSQAALTKALVWVKGKVLQPLLPDWGMGFMREKS